MSKFTALTDEIHAYMVERGARQDDLLARLQEETEREEGEMAVMQIAPDQGAFMGLLARAIGARRAIEVGTFTGYSAICIARALPDDGELVACELDPGRAEVARRWIAEAGLADRVDLRVGPASETLRALPEEEAFDLAFIDADKPGYADYYEQCLARLRAGGLVLLDNVLLSGRVVDPPADDESATALATLNDRLAGDERVDLAMVGIADGITIARKR
ncbi:MAG TPA: class I SAM-dependent methyltransferase [Solirubrobacterales bacterium]